MSTYVGVGTLYNACERTHGWFIAKLKVVQNVVYFRSSEFNCGRHRRDELVELLLDVVVEAIYFPCSTPRMI